MKLSNNIERKSNLRDSQKYSISNPQNRIEDVVKMEQHYHHRNHTFNPQQDDLEGVLVPTYRTQSRAQVNTIDPWLCPINGSQLLTKQIPPKKMVEANKNRLGGSKHPSDSLSIDNMFYREEEEDQSVKSGWSRRNLLPSGSLNLSYKNYYRSKKNHRHSGSRRKEKPLPKLKQNGKSSSRSKHPKQETKANTSSILPSFIKPLTSRHFKSKVKIKSKSFNTEDSNGFPLFERTNPINTQVDDLDPNSLCYCYEESIRQLQHETQKDEKVLPIKIDTTCMKFSSFVDIPGTNIPLCKYDCQQCNGFVVLNEEGLLFDFDHLYSSIVIDHHYYNPNLSRSEDSFSQFNSKHSHKTSLIPDLQVTSSKIPPSEEEKLENLRRMINDFSVSPELIPANKNVDNISKETKKRVKEKPDGTKKKGFHVVNTEFNNDPSPQSSAHKFHACFEASPNFSSNDAVDAFIGRIEKGDYKDPFPFHRESNPQGPENFHRERREYHDQNDFLSHSPTRQNDHVITYTLQDERSKTHGRKSVTKSTPQHYSTSFSTLTLPNFSLEQELDEDGFILSMPNKYNVVPQCNSYYPISFDYSGENNQYPSFDHFKKYDVSDEYGFHKPMKMSSTKSNNIDKLQSTPITIEPSMFDVVKQGVSIEQISFDDPFENLLTTSESNLETHDNSLMSITNSMSDGYDYENNEIIHMQFDQDSIENQYFPLDMNEFLDTVAAIVIQTEFRRFLARMLAMKRRWAIQTIQKTYRYYNRRQNSALKIQSCYRSWLVRDNLMVDHYCAIRIQSCVRRFLVRKWIIKYYDNMDAIFKSTCAVIIQSCFRGYVFRKSIVEEACAHSIQMCWRSYKTRQFLELYTKNVILLQSIARRYLVRKKMKTWNLSALKIQCRWRSYDCFLNYMHSLADILIAQSVARRWLVQKSIHNKLIKENVNKDKAQGDRLSGISENSSLHAIEILKRWRKSKEQIENSPILFVHPRRARISRFERTQGLNNIICDDPSLLPD